MGDIVKTLRVWSDRADTPEAAIKTCEAAAREIESLRAELKSAVGILRNIDGYADDCECFQCQNIKAFLANHSAPQESAQ